MTQCWESQYVAEQVITLLGKLKHSYCKIIIQNNQE